MKMCLPHWDALKDAIKERGMWPLVTESGEAATKRAVSEMENKATNETYDPLMSANFMIWNAALRTGGLYLMTGDYCPLCEADKHGAPGTASEWIRGCTDSVRGYCLEHGLMPN